MPIIAAVKNTKNIIVSVIKTPEDPDHTVNTAKETHAIITQKEYDKPVMDDISVLMP